FRTVTALTTALADAALTAALALAVRTVCGDEQLPMQLAVIAMGKCGAKELNYISDVDVIFVAEPVELGDDAGHKAMRKATRVAAEFNRIGTSCFFEVDANLRPEGKSGALVRSLDSHIKYYKRWAETWEFQAQLKARPQTGFMPLAKAYTDARSEEHTSELQSRFDLVCRLLLEKKKQLNMRNEHPHIFYSMKHTS